MKVSWDDVMLGTEKVIQLVKQYPQSHKIENVYGIPRGGMIPAALIARRLKLPMVPIPTAGSLVVDEIADTGSTLAIFQNSKTMSMMTATLHVRRTSIVVPTFYAFQVDHNEWLEYPWEENDETVRSNR